MSLSPPLSTAMLPRRLGQVMTPTRARHVTSALFVAAMALALALRLGPALHKPMWLDEAWTGMIAGQANLGGLVRQVRNDANAPLYYVLIWLWAKLAGVSNLALRVPNLLFGLGAGAVALLQHKTLGLKVAAAWSLLLVFWWPALDFNFTARCYVLLLLASTAATAAYVRLMQRPGLGRAAVWTTAASLMVLTHYHAALLVFTQSVLFAAVHRRRLLRLWPAALPFAPAFAWGLYHLPRLEQFARADVAWYPLLKASDLSDVLFFSGGGPLAIFAAAGVCGVALMTSGQGRARLRWTAPSPAGWALIASLLALGFCLLAASVRPTFTLRYLTAFAPGVLLGLALLSEQAARRLPIAALAIPLAFAMTAATLNHGDAPFGFEEASRYIAQGVPRRLEFFWDHPATRVEAPDQLSQVGGFFLQRAGQPVATDPIYVPAGGDPNAIMAARSGRGSALMWVHYNLGSGVVPVGAPPGALMHDPRWRCRDFIAAMGGVLACRPS